MKHLLLILLLWVSWPMEAQATVNVFPYGEGFETGFGEWTNSASDNIDWSRNTGQTPSSGTGPIGAEEGNWYIYTEASGNNPNYVAVLEATFDLSSLTNPVLSFYYHMYGNSMGELHVDVYSNSWTSIWQMVGQQQTWFDEAWRKVEVDLSAYTGSTNLMIRFRGITGSSYTSDISIDKIRLFDNVPRVELEPMNQEGFTAPGTYTDYKIKITNKTESDTAFDIYYSNNPWLTIGPVSTDVIPSGLSDDMVIYVYVPSGSFAGDMSTSNVKVISSDNAFEATASIETSCSWNTWPHVCESWDIFPNGWTNYAEGSTVFPWLQSGIGNPASGLYHPAYTEMFINWFVSPGIDLSDTYPEKLELTFDEFVIINTSYDYTGVFISTGSKDPADGDFVELLEIGGTSLNWKERKIDLTPYKGKNPVYFAFKYEGNDSHLPFIDNVCIKGIRYGINNSILKAPASATTMRGRPSPMFEGRLYINGTTGPDGPAERITAQVGLGVTGTNPQTGNGWLWYPMTYTGANGTNDVFSATPILDSLGIFDVAMRFRVGEADWVYTDLDGSMNGYDATKAGSLNVIPYRNPWPLFLPATLGAKH